MNLIKKIIIVFAFLMVPFQLNAREFLNTLLHINFTFMFGWSATGSILDEEHDSFSVLDSVNNKTIRPDHYDSAYGIIIDVTPMPSIILGDESHAIKFGVRAGYRFHSLQQEISTETNNYDGELLKFQTWMVGPVLYYAPSIEPATINREYNASAGIVFYVLYGQLTTGTLTAYPSMRDYGTTPPGEYETSITGYKIDIGIGGEVSICSLNFGMNIYYSIINITMDKQIYSNVSKETEIKEICVELFLGIPIDFY